MGKKKIHPGEVQPSIQAEDKTPKRKGWKSYFKEFFMHEKNPIEIYYKGIKALYGL
jgi:hypothetical protein